MAIYSAEDYFYINPTYYEKINALYRDKKTKFQDLLSCCNVFVDGVYTNMFFPNAVEPDEYNQTWLTASQIQEKVESINPNLTHYTGPLLMVFVRAGLMEADKNQSPTLYSLPDDMFVPVNR